MEIDAFGWNYCRAKFIYRSSFYLWFSVSPAVLRIHQSITAWGRYTLNLKGVSSHRILASCNASKLLLAGFSATWAAGTGPLSYFSQYLVKQIKAFKWKPGEPTNAYINKRPPSTVWVWWKWGENIQQRNNFCNFPYPIERVKCCQEDCMEVLWGGLILGEGPEGRCIDFTSFPLGSENWRTTDWEWSAIFQF